MFVIKFKTLPENPNGDSVFDDSFEQRENVDVSVVFIVIQNSVTRKIKKNTNL